MHGFLFHLLLFNGDCASMNYQPDVYGVYQMALEAKWKTAKEMVAAQAVIMEGKLKASPELKERMTNVTFVRFTYENWAALRPGKSIIVGISGRYMKVARFKN